jgi:hypothetical protein
LQILVNHVGVGKYCTGLWSVDENSFDGLYLIRIPHVILIAKEDNIAPALGYAQLKVACATHPLMLEEPDRKGRAPSEFSDDVRSRVSRCIVADYQFVRQSRLAGNTVQLLADVAFAVIAGERDR